MKSNRTGGAYLDVEVVNPDGQEIRIPKWAHRRLRRMGLCVWDRRGKAYRIDPRIFGLMALLQTPDFKPKGVRALKLEGKDRGRPKRCGRSSELLKVLAVDLSGLSHPSDTEIRSLREECRCGTTLLPRS